MEWQCGCRSAHAYCSSAPSNRSPSSSSILPCRLLPFFPQTACCSSSIASRANAFRDDISRFPLRMVFSRSFGRLLPSKNHIRVSFKQYSEGSSFLNQDEVSETTDNENGTLSASSRSSPSASILSPELSSEITDESFNETKRLVETAMFAAAAGLAYFLSNTFRIENYFGCFFPLPLVISSLRWGVTAGRKTLIATVMLLLVLSGPLKAATYLLMHGLLGLTMGALWRSSINWSTSLIICTLVRSAGAMGFVFLTSWLIRENLLVLITINAHASISLLLATMGINIVPSMGSIYFIFGTLVLVNCGSFVLILHVLYAIFLKRLELNSPLVLPSWLKSL